MVQWASRGKAATDESTPIMHPVRMELAPHVRLGRRVNASMAIFVLLIFHVSILAVGILNWESACEGRLALFLIIYGGIGLLFIYLLFREWLYYARLSSLPTMTNLVLLILFYVCLCVAGGFLTVRARSSERPARPAWMMRRGTREPRTAVPERTRGREPWTRPWAADATHGGRRTAPLHKAHRRRLSRVRRACVRGRAAG